MPPKIATHFAIRNQLRRGGTDDFCNSFLPGLPAGSADFDHIFIVLPGGMFPRFCN